MWKISIVFAVMSGAAAAQELRANDVVFTQAALAARLTGQEIVFYDNGRAVFGDTGTYTYIYDGGNAASGTYAVTSDSQVCVEFDNGFSRCDTYVENGTALVLITTDGDRFPVRP